MTVFCVHLQRCRRNDCSGDRLSVVRTVAQPDNRQRGDDVQLRVSDWKRFETAARRAVERMYTGSVVRFRLFAFVLTLLFAVTPVLGVVCQMDCGQPPKSAACHESTTSSDGPSVRSTHHLCDHDHTGDGPALMAGTTGARESIGSAPVSVSISALVHQTVPEVRTAIADMHGPPGLTSRSVSSRITVLRI